jgi:hypothetical protein
MINRLIRFLILLLLAPAMWVLFEEAGLFLTTNLPGAFSNWAVYGFVVYFLFYPFFLGNVMRFFETLEHEVTHAVFAFLCFEDVRKLEVELPSGSGEVQVSNETGTNALVFLAPYFVPLLALPPLLIKWLAFPDSHGPLDMVIGLTLGFHFAGLVRELSYPQTDILRTGPVVSMTVILFANTLLLVVALGVVLSDYAALGAYFATSFARIPAAYSDLMWMLEQGLRWTSGLD